MRVNDDRAPKIDMKLLPHQLGNQSMVGVVQYKKSNNLVRAGLILNHITCDDGSPMFHISDLLGNWSTLQLKLLLSGKCHDKFSSIDYSSSFKTEFLEYKLINGMTVLETWDLLSEKLSNLTYANSNGMQ